MLYQNGSLNTLHNDKTVINKVLNFLISIKSSLWRNATIENWRNATIRNCGVMPIQRNVAQCHYKELWSNATIEKCGVMPLQRCKIKNNKP